MNKASGGDRIPVALFQILKDDAVTRTSKIMLKTLQARFQQYVNHEFPDIQAGFRKGRRTRHQIANIWIIKKGRE